MPPASLSTMETMMPGPRTLRKSMRFFRLNLFLLLIAIVSRIRGIFLQYLNNYNITSQAP